MEFIDSFRQLFYPGFSRIDRPQFAAMDLPGLDRLVMAAGRTPESAQPARRPPPAPAARDEHGPAGMTGSMEQLKFLADLGTGLWRLRQKLVNPETDEPLEETRRAWRHFESVWDLLDKVGIEVKDHTNTPYHAGSSLHVIAFQPTDGVSKEHIIETIRPSIYLQKRPLQMGEVIVAIPPKSDEA